MKPFKLTDLTTYRSEHMGLAMIYIMLFHISLPQNDIGFGLHRLGNIGVDMFLLLSGIGLWYSWQKDSNTLRFWKKRYIRVYPAYFICALIYYLIKYKGGMEIWGDPNNCLVDLVMDICFNWDFWWHEELTFWFIPCIMMLYMLTPAYMKAINRWPSMRWIPGLLICWCMMMWWVYPIHHAVYHLEIFWSRMPIFFIGINMAVYVKEKREIEPQAFWLLLGSLLFFGWCVVYLEQYQRYKYPLYIERMVYIPMTFSILLLEGKLLERCGEKIKTVLRLIGTVSLELYLVHELMLFFGFEKLVPYNYWIRFAALFVCALPVAWLLHQLVGRLKPKG